MAEETPGSDTDDAADADGADGGRDGSFTLTGVWDREEMRAFLEDLVAPIRLSCHTPAGDLWMLSLWYSYRDGRLHCSTASSSAVVRYLRADPHVAFEVSVNDPPYRGVRGRGEARLDPDPEKDLLRDLLTRYLGGTDSTLAARLLDDDRDETTIRIDPETVYCWDYSARMAEDG